MELQNNTYHIQNVAVTALAEKYGLPLFIYDSAKMIAQYERLTSAFDVPNLKIHYACKALTNLSVLRLFKKLGAGLDCVSIQEVYLGLKAGFKPEEILFTPNAVSFEELEEAISYGVKMNIDNLETLEYIGHKHPNTPVCVRINPHIMAGGNRNISVGHIDSKFGISIHQIPLLERIVKSLDIKVEGLHMHTGSDILDSEIFLHAAELLFEVAEKFIENLTYIDFGSGFKVKYKPQDYETDIENFGKEMSEAFQHFCQKMNKDLCLIFEPGKFLVSNSGYFLVKTNVVKQTTSTVFACLDSGFNHLIRPMFYNAYHHIVNVSNPNDIPKLYTLVGYICETDTFGWNRRISHIKQGDILAFYNAGAYCYSMASNYNSRYRPAEVMIHEGKDYLIRERETFEDLIRNQVESIFTEPILSN